MNVMNYQDYDVIQHVFDAIEKEDIGVAQEYLAGNFKSVLLKENVNRDQFLEIYRRIKEGLPDAKFEIVDISSDGETFKANVKITGTHTQTIPSLKKGWRAMKPTGKKINKVVSSIEIILRSDRILEIKNVNENKGVISELLNELKLLPKSYFN